jgi:hypothetical protein
MRHLFFLLTLFALPAFAAEVFAVKSGPDRFSYYTKDAADSTLYYKSGVTAAPCRVTGFLKVRLAEGTDPEAVIREFGLELHERYPEGLYFFKTSAEAAMPAAALIWERPGVLFAEPVCARTKRLL